MVSVWKYEVPIDDRFTLNLPCGAEVLTVQMQGVRPCLWVRVDPTERMEPRRFCWTGTGHEREFDELRRYVGTVQMDGGALVFHLFEQ